MDNFIMATQLTYAKDYDLSAVFMRNWDTRDESGSDKGCEWEKDWEDVQRVCRTIDLPCEMVCPLPLHRTSSRRANPILEEDRPFPRLLESCLPT